MDGGRDSSYFQGAGVTMLWLAYLAVGLVLWILVSDDKDDFTPGYFEAAALCMILWPLLVAMVTGMAVVALALNYLEDRKHGRG